MEKASRRCQCSGANADVTPRNRATPGQSLRTRAAAVTWLRRWGVVSVASAAAALGNAGLQVPLLQQLSFGCVCCACVSLMPGQWPGYRLTWGQWPLGSLIGGTAYHILGRGPVCSASLPARHQRGHKGSHPPTPGAPGNPAQPQATASQWRESPPHRTAAPQGVAVGATDLEVISKTGCHTCCGDCKASPTCPQLHAGRLVCCSSGALS